MPRLFIALPLPDDVHDQLAQLQAQVRHDFRHSKIRWVEPANFHITLHFIGDVDEQLLPQLIDDLRSIDAPPAFSLKLERVDAFPHRKNPKTIIVATNNHPHVTTLRRRLADVLTRHNLPFDGKIFTPHITLGRVTTRSEVLRNVPVSPITWIQASFALVESTLTPEGSVYRTLTDVSLKPYTRG